MFSMVKRNRRYGTVVSAALFLLSVCACGGVLRTHEPDGRVLLTLITCCFPQFPFDIRLCTIASLNCVQLNANLPICVFHSYHVAVNALTH